MNSPKRKFKKEEGDSQNYSPSNF